MPENRTRRTTLLVSCTLAFLVLGIAVKFNALEDIDRAVAVWFAFRINPALTSFAFYVTQLGSSEVTLSITALAALLLYRQGARYWLKRLCLTVAAAMIANELLKLIFYRSRPDPRHRLLEVYTNSFPSGHALSATVLFGSLILVIFSLSRSRWLRAASIVLFVGLIVMVSASRIYLGVHYFSDVIGGILEGIAWINGLGLIIDSTREARA